MLANASLPVYFTWVEDFVDEDTGEVVSIERNEIILERFNSWWSKTSPWSRNGCEERVYSERRGERRLRDHLQHVEQDTSNSELEAVQHIYRNCVVLMLRMMKLHVVSLINYSSATNVMTCGKLVVIRSTVASTPISLSRKKKSIDQRRYHRHHQNLSSTYQW